MILLNIIELFILKTKTLKQHISPEKSQVTPVGDTVSKKTQ